MSLGIGGATPFSMKSNHQTVFNHSYRDVSQHDPSRHNKIKCSFCGCWATKGGQCYQCKRRVGGVPSSYPASSSMSYDAPLSARRPSGPATYHNHHYQNDQPQQPQRPYSAAATNNNNYSDGKAAAAAPPPVRYLNEQNQQQPPPRGDSSSRLNSTRASSASASRRRPADNALTHNFRDTSAYDPAARLRVKCRYCGCWASRGTHCNFCRTFNK